MPRRTTSKIQISASDVQKAKLAQAARARQMDVTQFVLSTSLDAADQLLDDEPDVMVALKAQLEKLRPLSL